MIPPRTILAAVDFSEPSRVALTLAGRLATQCGAALYALHAQDPLLSAAAAVQGIDLTTDTREQLETFVRSAIPRKESTSCHVVTGPAVDVIGDIAVRERADVIVMGVRGMGAAEHAVFGSTTENVLRRADVAVLAVPDGWLPPRPDTDDLTGTGPVVAAVDFGPSSLAAASAASRLANKLGTSLELVHIVPAVAVLDRWRGHAEALVSDQLDTAGRELAATVHMLKSGVPVGTRVETGRVHERLAAIAAPGPGRHPILVLGRRARADRHGAPGATAYRVLTRAHVPLLVYLMDT